MRLKSWEIAVYRSIRKRGKIARLRAMRDIVYRALQRARKKQEWHVRKKLPFLRYLNARVEGAIRMNIQPR